MNGQHRFAVLRTAAAVLGAIIIALAGTAAPARGAQVGKGASGQVAVYTCTDITLIAQTAGARPCRKIFGRVPNGTQVQMRCWIDDVPLIPGPYARKTGKRSPRWFYMNAGALNGWVHSAYMPVQDRVDNCAAPQHRGVLAANWAHKQRYSHTAGGDVIGWFSDWNPGPQGEWAFDCAKFAVSSWRKAGSEIARGNASAQHAAYQGRLQQGLPPAGALVFWPNVARPFGHVAIADGNGSYITTQGRDGSFKPVIKSKLAGYGTPAGWVLP